MFPPKDFVRQGPPVGVRDLDRVGREKWSRLMVLSPVRVQADDDAPPKWRFRERGPYTLPLATRAAGADAGSLDAWTFFTHPYTVFPPDSAYYNVPGQGCLETRLAVRSDDGIRLYDEVGAGFPQAEMVPSTYAAALGVLRKRALGENELSLPYAASLAHLDLDLLELFRLSTLLLHTENPLDTVLQLDRLLKNPTIARFAQGLFDAGDQAAMQAILSDQGATRGEAGRFRVSQQDFAKVAEIQDARGRPAIAGLLTEWEAFHAEHGQRLAEIDRQIDGCEQSLVEIRQKVLELQEGTRQSGRISRLLNRPDRQLKQLKADAVHHLRTRRALEGEIQAIPGYEQLRGLSERIQDVQDSIDRIFQIARDLFDHNVSQTQLRSLLNVLRERVLSEADPQRRTAGFRNYDLRLRAEVMAKLLTTYSLSAYVLRRPDALQPDSASHRNLVRINRMAKALIEYFNDVRYGNKTVGQAWDESWGQVVAIEGQL